MTTDHTPEPLAPIITDLLTEIFNGAVTLQDVITRLKDLAQHELGDASAPMILDAIRGDEQPPTDWLSPNDANINWNEIHFGCQETLAFLLFAIKPHTLREDFNKQLDEDLDMCAYFLCAALQTQACRKLMCHGLCCPLNYVLRPFTIYEHIPAGYTLDEFLHRLLRYMFRD